MIGSLLVGHKDEISLESSVGAHEKEEVMLCARVGFKDELDGCNRGILDTTHKMQWISGANPMFDGRIEGQVFVLIDGNRRRTDSGERTGQ